MPYTAAEVIDGARGLDPTFSPEKHPERVCLEFLTRFQRRLAPKILQVEKESISEEISIALPLADFSAGAALESAPGVPLQYDRLHGFSLEDGEEDRWPLPIVPFKARFTHDRGLTGWLRQGVLFLGHRASSYTGYSAIICTYAPTPGLVATLATLLILPDNAFEVCILALGGELAKRRPDEVVRTTLPAEAKEAEIDFLNVLEERNDVDIGSVRRVFS